MPGQLGDRALARQRRDRRGASRTALAGVAVGEHAVHDGAVELVEVGRARRRARRWWRWADRASALALGYAALMRGAAWLDPPDLQRGREHRGDRRAPPTRVLAGAAPEGSPHPGRRRRLARRHRARSPTAWRPSPTRSRCCTAPSARASALPTSRASRRALDGGAALRLGDGRRLLPRPRGPRAPARAPARGGADLALGSRYVAGGGVTDWGCVRRRSAAAARGTRGACSACEVRDLTGGFKCFRAEVLRGDRPADRALARLRLPGRADLPRRAAPASASSRCRSCSATAGWARSKMSWRIAAEAMWLVPRLRRGAGACERRAQAAAPARRSA